MNYLSDYKKMINLCLRQADIEKRALIFAEYVGAVEYHVAGNKMIFYASYPIERSTVRAVVNLETMEEKREYLKNYYPAYKSLIGGRYQANFRI